MSSMCAAQTAPGAAPRTRQLKSLSSGTLLKQLLSEISLMPACTKVSFCFLFPKLLILYHQVILLLYHHFSIFMYRCHKSLTVVIRFLWESRFFFVEQKISVNINITALHFFFFLWELCYHIFLSCNVSCASQLPFT